MRQRKCTRKLLKRLTDDDFLFPVDSPDLQSDLLPSQLHRLDLKIYSCREREEGERKSLKKVDMCSTAVLYYSSVLL